MERTVTTETFVQPHLRAPLGVLSILTLVLGLFIGYGAVILGILALRQNWVKGTRGSALAWVGIILGTIVGTLWSLALMVLLF